MCLKRQIILNACRWFRGVKKNCYADIFTESLLLTFLLGPSANVQEEGEANSSAGRKKDGKHRGSSSHAGAHVGPTGVTDWTNVFIVTTTCRADMKEANTDAHVRTCAPVASANVSSANANGVCLKRGGKLHGLKMYLAPMLGCENNHDRRPLEL